MQVLKSALALVLITAVLGTQAAERGSSYNCCLNVDGCNLNQDTGACECPGLMPFVTCQWQRARHAVSRLTGMTQHIDHTEGQNEPVTPVVQSLRSMELAEDKLHSNRSSASRSNSQAQTKPNVGEKITVELKIPESDTGGGGERYQHLDPISESGAATYSYGNDSVRTRRKRDATPFVADPSCCSGSDARGSSLGCVLTRKAG